MDAVSLVLPWLLGLPFLYGCFRVAVWLDSRVTAEARLVAGSVAVADEADAYYDRKAREGRI